jgi:hypothetical protein
MESDLYKNLREKIHKMNKKQYYDIVVEHYKHISKKECILCEISKIARKNVITTYFD